MSKKEPSRNEIPEQYTVRYIKNNLHRMIYVNSYWVAATPNLDICLSLGNEIVPIPEKIVYNVNSDGSLGDEDFEKREQAEGVSVELEVSAIINLEEAKKLIDALQRIIKEIEEIDREIEEDEY